MSNELRILTMKKILFICSRNKLRSPTAETIFSEYSSMEVASAGLNKDAEVTVTPELILWADIIFVMEKVHRQKLSHRFKKYLNKQKVVCLDIPDIYEYMDNKLILLLKNKVPQYL